MTRYEQVMEQLRAQPRTWLITGVAGFIGSNLLEKLLELGQTVIGLDDFSSGYRRNIDEVRPRDRRARKQFGLIEGDIRDAATCKAATTGVDYVLHQAAIGSVPRSVLDPALVNDVNVDGTLRVLTAAREAGVKRVVFASSSAVFGDSATMPVAEEMLGGMLSPYAVSKYTDEKYAEVFSRIYAVETVGLRYFNVFGPRQDPLGSYAAVIPQWIHAMLSGEVCHIHGDGETTRDFVAIADVVQANLLAAVSPLPAATRHRVYNVGAGRRTSLNELQSLLAAALKSLRPGHDLMAPVHDAFREGDIRHSQADIGRITAELGYAPAPDLALGLQATMRWYLKRLTESNTLARTA